jgi:hypothetical protein
MNSTLSRKIRRYAVHILWLAVACMAFGCGIKLGFRAYLATIGVVSLNNQRSHDMDNLTTALRVAGKDRLDTYRHSADWRIRESVFLLGFRQRYSACLESERQALDAARDYLSTHPFPVTGSAEDPFATGYAAGLDACKGAPSPVPSLFF